MFFTRKRKFLLIILTRVSWHPGIYEAIEIRPSANTPLYGPEGFLFLFCSDVNMSKRKTGATPSHALFSEIIKHNAFRRMRSDKAMVLFSWRRNLFVYEAKNHDPGPNLNFKQTSLRLRGLRLFLTAHQVNSSW